MSIFKETFRDFVFKQLRIREAIVKQGNGAVNRTGRPRIDIQSSATTTEKLPLPAGAFYTNTVERQCVIRMCSGVDLNEKNTILDSDDPRHSDLIGNGLAIRYILEGGVAAKNIDINIKGSRTLGKGNKLELAPRGRDHKNFSPGSYGSSYGDPYIRSDAKDGYGIVPMPGIIDANIRTKTAYGSLREAKVKFVCHNRRQLEVLELLYMRPGFPIMLEWGWSTFVNNDGLKGEFPPLMHEFFIKDYNISSLQKSIIKNKLSTGGNYDAFVGYCKNFEFTSRSDGGYDCTTEIIAMGQVLEGLKGRREGKVMETEAGDYEVDNLEYYLHALKTFTSQGIVEGIEGTMFAGFDHMRDEDEERLNAEIRRNVKTYNSFIEILMIYNPNAIVKRYSDSQLEDIIKYESEFQKLMSVGFGTGGEEGWGRMNVSQKEHLQKDLLAGNQKHAFDNMSDDFRTEGFGLLQEYHKNLDSMNDIIDKVIIRKKEPLGIDGEEEIATSSNSQYIRWDFLVMLLNTSVIDQTKIDDDPITRISYLDGLHTSSAPLKYVSGPLKAPILTDFSVDPLVCMLPHQMKRSNDEKYKNIKDIFLCVPYLYKTYMDLRYIDGGLDPDFSIFKWLDKVWEGVNLATGGNHDFTLTTELERPEVLRVVDMIFESPIQPEELFEVKIQGNESIVRDFSYNTTIPSALGATIAIAAQSPNSINDLDQVTFAAFNKNTNYRFYQEENEQSESEIKLLAERFERQKSELASNMQALMQYHELLLEGEMFADQEEKLDAINKQSASNMLKSLATKSIGIMSKFQKNTVIDGVTWYKGMTKPNPKMNKSAIIPLKFTFKIDGIGGIVIGNVFKVQKDRLPKGYQGDDIAFIAMTEQQNITSGQDWTTDISGQLVLLDIHPEDENEYALWDDMDLDPNKFGEGMGVNYQVDQKDWRTGLEFRKEDDISLEQRNTDPYMNEVFAGSRVYLKLNEETNIRSGPIIDNESYGWTLNYDDNNIGTIKGERGMYLGVVKKVQNADSLGDLEWISDEDHDNGGYYKNTETGAKVEGASLNTTVPWYWIEFDIGTSINDITPFRKAFNWGSVMKGGGTIDDNGADEWDQFMDDGDNFQFDTLSDHIDTWEGSTNEGIDPTALFNRIEKGEGGRGWMRIDVLMSGRSVEDEKQAAIQQQNLELQDLDENGE